MYLPSPAPRADISDQRVSRYMYRREVSLINISTGPASTREDSAPRVHVRAVCIPGLELGHAPLPVPCGAHATAERRTGHCAGGGCHHTHDHTAFLLCKRSCSTLSRVPRPTVGRSHEALSHAPGPSSSALPPKPRKRASPHWLRLSLECTSPLAGTASPVRLTASS